MSKYIFILLILFVSCTREKAVKTYYDSGNLYEVIEMSEDSIRNGVYLKFAENGDTLEKSIYKNGKLNGQRLLYFDSNKVEVVETYKLDSLFGPYRVYYEEGGLSLETVYSDNILDGIVRRYFPSGKLMEEVTFLNNEENGPFVEYFEGGGKRWEGNYKNGDNEIGLLLEFAENGDTIKKMMCDDRHICTTIWRNPDYPLED